MRFSDLGLSPELLEAIEAAGYETPTPIQAEAIPQALSGRDVLGIAQTGTGKTASFTLPMIEKLSKGRARARMPRSLILEPTRELADQVASNFEIYGKNHKLTMALLIGGVSFDEQERKLNRGVDVLIATPGRLLDHFERGKLMLNGVEIMVIDEADRMLDMGFIPDIERIWKLLPFTRQTLFFSATMPPEIQHLTERFLHNPARIEVARPASTVETVAQTLVPVPREPKLKREALRRLIRQDDVKNAIIFCNRKRDVDVVSRSLITHKFSAAPLHGDLEQSVRMKTLENFRTGEVKFLVASDVAARGLDIPAVSHVFNFDVPTHAEDYVHRIGRTGRAGRSGAAFTLVTPAEEKYIAAIESLTGKPLQRMTLEGLTPAGTETEEKRGRAKGKARQEKSAGRSRRKKASPAGKSRKNPPADAASPEPAPPLPTARSKAAGRDAGHEDSRTATKGLGPHTPAFLLREVRLPRAGKTRDTAKP